MNTTVPNDKIENAGATAQGRVASAENNNIVDTINSKRDRLKNVVNIVYNPNITLDTTLQAQPANAAAPYKDIHRVPGTGVINFVNPADGYVGQPLVVEITSDGTPRSHTWGTKFKFSDSDFKPDPYSDTAGAVDVHWFEFDGVNWKCVKTSLNYQ